MAITQLAPPYPIFTDRDGSPLDAGYLYFGEVNQNPETNPIQIYYDSAFTIPAAQPLRTSNGYVMRNGSPALIYANSQFSVTVRDKRSELVIYSPVGYGIIPGTSATSTDQMTYNEGSTGAVPRVLTARLQDRVSVKDFGAVGDGVTDDTAAVQAAVDSIKNVGGSIYFPSGTYLCNAVIDGSQTVDFHGDGYSSALQSNLNNQFAVRYERTFRTPHFSDIRFQGVSKNTHGLYVNIGSKFSASNVHFHDCGMGLVFNATIDTRLNNCFWQGNYVGLYYTCRTTAGNPTVASINGQSYTFSSAFFPQQPGESDVIGPFFNLNNIGLVIDQPNNPFPFQSNIKIHGGLIQASFGAGVFFRNGGPVDSSAPSFIKGTWFESAPTSSFVFDGVTYTTTGDVVLLSGNISLQETRNQYLSVVGGLMKAKGVTFVTNSSIIRTGGSLITEDCVFSDMSDNSKNCYTMRPISPRQGRTQVVKVKGLAGSTYKFSDKTNQSVKLVNADTLTFFGAGSSANVVDGVLDVKECKEVTLTTSGNGPFLFSNTGGVTAGKYYVGIVSMKWISGDKRLRIFNNGGGAAFGVKEFDLEGGWETLAFLTLSATTSAASPTNVLTFALGGTGSVVRLSGVCIIELDSIEETTEFFDMGAFPLI